MQFHFYFNKENENFVKFGLLDTMEIHDNQTIGLIEIYRNLSIFHAESKSKINTCKCANKNCPECIVQKLNIRDYISDMAQIRAKYILIRERSFCVNPSKRCFNQNDLLMSCNILKKCPKGNDCIHCLLELHFVSYMRVVLGLDKEYNFAKTIYEVFKDEFQF